MSRKTSKMQTNRVKFLFSSHHANARRSLNEKMNDDNNPNVSLVMVRLVRFK